MTANWVFRAVLAGIWIAGGAVADVPAWVPPALVPDNSILKIAQGRWKTKNGKFMVLGIYGYPERYHPGSEMFWREIITLDREGVVGYARPTDGVGMAYGPPFVVLFPTQSEIEEIKDTLIDGAVFERSLRTHQVQVVNLPDAFSKAYSDGFLEGDIRQLNTVRIYFHLDIDAGEVPGVCHARQVITILYTGEPNEVELATCLEADRTK